MALIFSLDRSKFGILELLLSNLGFSSFGTYEIFALTIDYTIEWRSKTPNEASVNAPAASRTTALFVNVLT